MPTPTKTKYGLTWNADASDIMIEFEMIRGFGYRTSGGVKHGNGLAYHIIAAQKIIWPYKRWHKWNQMLVEEFAKGGTTAVFGPASSGKSHEIADFNLTLYFAFPKGFTCIMSTTTSEMLDFRIFGQAKKQFHEAKNRHPWLPGVVVNSRHCIVTDEGEAEDRDFRNGIKGVACVQGGTFKGLGNYIGIKNNIMSLAADEVPLMGDGFLKAAANLKNNPHYFGIFAGNLSDLDNPMAEAAEPEMGWDSIGDTEKSRVYKTKFMHGRAVQLIGTDSPNFDYPEGSEPYPFLIGRKNIAEAAHDYGVDSPLYNMFAKGKIPRDTMENRVISELICKKFEAYDPVVWGSTDVKRIYAADISYTKDHGDRTVGMPIAFGQDVNGEWKIAPLDPPMTYNLKGENESPVEQIACIMKAECERWNIPPEHVFFDGTGRSSFTSAIMRLWSTKVNAVEFGGGATLRQNFLNRRYKDGNQRRKEKAGDLMPCNEVFGKLVSELWFAWTAAVEANQVRNLSPQIVKDGQRRLWFRLDNNKMDVEPKTEMKTRTGRSPDLADAWCVGLEGARRLGFPLGKLEPVEQKKKNLGWLKKLSKDFNESARGKELEYA